MLLGLQHPWEGEAMEEGKQSPTRPTGRENRTGIKGSAVGEAWGSGGGRAPYLQHRHLLPVAKQSEAQGVPGVQARDHLAAAERDGGDVALQVGPVLVQHELVVLDPAPALPPAVVGEHAQVACNNMEDGCWLLGTTAPRLVPRKELARGHARDGPSLRFQCKRKHTRSTAATAGRMSDKPWLL